MTYLCSCISIPFDISISLIQIIPTYELLLGLNRFTDSSEISFFYCIFFLVSFTAVLDGVATEVCVGLISERP